MLSLELEMVQYDCPYIDASNAADVIFFTKQWNADAEAGTLETRVLAHGGTSISLDRGLETLRTHDTQRELEVLQRDGERALLRSVVSETEAMAAVRANDGYIAGPFEVKEGTELWRIGFDSEQQANSALVDLDRHTEFTVRSRETANLVEYYHVLQHVDRAAAIFQRCDDLTDVEREALLTAAANGYFEEPRGATLADLAAEFEVSKAAVSTNLRRGQRKLLERIVDAFDVVHGVSTIDPETVTRGT